MSGPNLWGHVRSIYSLSESDIADAVKVSKEYSDEELKNINLGMSNVYERISSFLFEYEAIKKANKLEVSTIFVQGKFDMATPTSLVEAYYEAVEVPKGKKLVIFEKSAHFPMYEEPTKFLNLLKATLLKSGRKDDNAK